MRMGTELWLYAIAEEFVFGGHTVVVCVAHPVHASYMAWGMINWQVNTLYNIRHFYLILKF